MLPAAIGIKPPPIAFHPRLCSLSPKFSPSLQMPRRSAAQQPINHERPSKNVALLIGGGSPGRAITRLWRENLASRAEYKDIQIIDSAFRRTGLYDSKNITILFGNGANSQKVDIWESSLTRAISRWRGYRLTKQIRPFPNLQGPATVQQIEKEFKRLAGELKPHDSLSILITGHGRKFGGTILWNDYFSFEFITKRQLSKYLALLPLDVSVYLFVDSCYSGHYLSLSSRNVTVLCSSNSTKVSHFFDAKGSKAVGHFAENLISRKISILRAHAQGSVMQSNYHALDSLSFFLHKEFEKHLGKNWIQDAVEKTMTRINTKVWGPLSIEMGFIGLIIMDPTGITLTYANTKLALAFGKLSVPLFKASLIYFFKSQYEAVKESICKTAWYKERYVRKDKKAIERMNRIVSELKQLRLNQSEEKQRSFYEGRKRVLELRSRELDFILNDLQELKRDRSHDDTVSAYYHLHDKAELFVSYADKNQLEEFIDIGAKLTAKPFSQPKSFGVR